MKRLALLAVWLALPACSAIDAQLPGGGRVRKVDFVRHSETRWTGEGSASFYHCAHVASPGLIGGALEGAALGFGLSGGQPLAAAGGSVIGAAGEAVEMLGPVRQRDYCIQPWAPGAPPARRGPRMPQEARSRGVPTDDPLGAAIDELRAEAVRSQLRSQPIAATPVHPLLGPTPGIAVGKSRVVDGDTVEVEAIFPIPELGMEVRLIRQVRLRGFDAPELRGRCEEERVLARDAAGRLAELIARSKRLRLVGWDLAGDRYGRPLARLYGDGQDLLSILASEGLARPYSGEGPRQPWCPG